MGWSDSQVVPQPWMKTKVGLFTEYILSRNGVLEWWVDIVRTRVSAVVIRDKKVLLVRGKSGFYKDFYFTPGGKVEESETDEMAMNRELHEELSLGYINKEFLFEYEALNWDKGIQRVRCYLVDVEVDKIKLSGEIGKMIWYTGIDFEENIIPISPSMAEFLMPRLIEEGYL